MSAVPSYRDITRKGRDRNDSIAYLALCKEIQSEDSYFVKRVKGFQVAPAELESVIREHPDVADAGVIGIPDPRTGEAPKAYIVLKPGHKTEVDNIKSFVAERVAEYKRVKEVAFIDSLPKSPAGKLLRRVLKDKN